MLEKIREYFRGFFREEIKEEEVSVANLEEWFSSKAAAVFASAAEKIKESNQQIAITIGETKEKIKALEAAELRNPNIPERAKHFMQGNRENYIKQISMFLDNIQLVEDAGAISDFISKFEQAAESLGKSTMRSYQFLQEFFADESRQVSGGIKQLADIVSRIKEYLDDTGINGMDTAKKLISSLNNKIKKKEELEADLKAVNEKFASAGEAFRMAKNQLEAFLKSSAYSEYEKLKSERHSLAEQIRALESELSHNFAALEKALKKFEKISYDKAELINKYLENPVTALVDDFEMRIVEVLKDLEKSLDKLDIRDKKREKTIEAISKMNKEFFGRFLTQYNKLVKGKNNVSVSIRDSGVEEKEGRLRDDAGLREKEVKAIENKIEFLSQEIAKIDIEKIKKEIREKIRKLFSVSVLIA